MCGAADQHIMVQEDWQAVGIKVANRVVTRELADERMASNQEMFSVWGWGLAVGLGMFEVLIDLPGQYSIWYNTSGKKGVEPPADHPIREIWSLFEKVKVEADETKRWQSWLKIRDINKENLWRIGVAGAGPILYIAKNNFRNVPAGLIDNNTLRNEGLAMPQQFYIKQS